MNSDFQTYTKHKQKPQFEFEPMNNINSAFALLEYYMTDEGAGEGEGVRGMQRTEDMERIHSKGLVKGHVTKTPLNPSVCIILK